MGREGDEQRHDQEHLAEELETHKVERDGHVRRAAPLVELELERDRDVGVDGSDEQDRNRGPDAGPRFRAAIIRRDRQDAQDDLSRRLL